MSADDDRARVRRAALSVGATVGIASALIIAAGVGILVAVILLTARREGEHHGPSDVVGDGDDIVVDVDHVLPWIIALGVAGVILLALVAWLAARRSVRPLSEALRLQRNFVADASHELRTPLTTLTSRIQVLQRRHERGEAIDQPLAELRRDADTMSDVLTDLLLAAEGRADASAAPASVAASARDAAGVIGPLADEAGVRIAVDAAPGTAVAMPAVTLTRLIVALLDNAVQHSPHGGRVALSAHGDGRMVALRVADEGTGIHGLDPERVFDRFARSGESGRRRGFGLGLALVREGATRYCGSVEVESTSDVGTTFLLRLPIADQAATKPPASGE